MCVYPALDGGGLCMQLGIYLHATIIAAGSLQDPSNPSRRRFGTRKSTLPQLELNHCSTSSRGLCGRLRASAGPAATTSSVGEGRVRSMQIVHALGVLGLDAGCTDFEEVKRAYRSACVRFHPDKNLDATDVAEQKFKEVQQAFRLLTQRATGRDELTSEAAQEAMARAASFISQLDAQSLGTGSGEEDFSHRGKTKLRIGSDGTLYVGDVRALRDPRDPSPPLSCPAHLRRSPARPFLSKPRYDSLIPQVGSH